MKRFTFLLAVALIGFLFSGSLQTAEARGKRYVRIAPPAHRVVVVKPACPYKSAVWASGYWSWKSSKHVWVDGRWLKPKRGHAWVDGRWVDTRQGWEWIPGHWRRL